MHRPYRAALNPGASAGPLLGHQNPPPSREAGSFLGQTWPTASGRCRASEWPLREGEGAVRRRQAVDRRCPPKAAARATFFVSLGIRYSLW